MADEGKRIAGRRFGSVFWLKGLAILLVILFVFTIVSRAAASFTVAKVTVMNISERKIQHIVRTEGRIEQNGTFAVITEPDLLVAHVKVREGELVEEGEVLFELDPEDLAEQIEDIQGQIQALKLQNSALQENKEQSDVKRDTDIQRAKEDYEDTVEKNEEAVAAARQALAAAEEELTKAGNELREAEETLAEAEKGAEAVQDDAMQTEEGKEPMLENLRTDVEEKQAAYDACKAAVSEKSSILDAAIDNRQSETKAAERALEDAKSPSPADNSTQINDISMKELEHKLEKLQDIENQDGCVTSPESGVVTKLDVAVGQKTTEVAAVTMSDADAGMRFSAQISKEDGQYVSVGDTVTLQGAGKSEAECEIVSVEADETGEGLNVTADLDAGQFQIGELVSMKAVLESQTYSCTVPLTALLQENGKMFVLILDTEDTILGEQYVARKVEVDVLDKNADYAALDGSALSTDSQIITDTDRYVEAGDRVRLMEE